jgi:hypothetical protein
VADLAANAGDLAGYIAKKAAASLLKAAHDGGWEDPTAWILATVVVLQALNEVGQAIWGGGSLLSFKRPLSIRPVSK